MVVVVDEKRPFFKGEPQLAVFEHRAVLVAQDRNQDLVLQLFLDRVPVDIEKTRIGGAGAIFQHIHPEGIPLSLDAHMVRDDVQDLAHVPPLQFADQRLVFILRADLRVQAVLVQDVVAVQAARARLEVG